VRANDTDGQEGYPNAGPVHRGEHADHALTSRFAVPHANARPHAGPSSDAIDELKKPDGRVLLLGEHFGRLRQLAERLLRLGCRVELAGIEQAPAALELASSSYRFMLLDAMVPPRGNLELLETLREEDRTMPIIVVGARNAPRPRIAGAHYVNARLGDAGSFADVSQLVDAVLTTWNEVRPLIGPVDLRIDRIIQRASVRGRQLSLRPFDFRLLLRLAESGEQGCAIEQLSESAWNGRRMPTRHAGTAVRQGLDRLRSALRRAGIAIASDANARYRLCVRDDARASVGDT